MRRTLLTAALLSMFGVVGPAHAGFSVKLQSIAEELPGTSWLYTYELIFQADSVTSALVAGDFFTIYDVEGLISATAPAGFGVTIQFTGFDAVSTTPIDSASLPNVTFTRTGGNVTASTTFLAEIRSEYGTTKQGQFTAQSSTPALQGAIGPVTVAAVPEPSALLLSGEMAVFVGLGLSWRRRRGASKVAA